MTSGQILHPEVLWAQRANEIYLTINLPDAKDPRIDVTKDKISFQGVGGTEQKLYGFDLEFYKEINPETLKRSQTARYIFLVLDKVDHSNFFWPRLQKEGRVSFLKTDFARWKDEDDEEEDQGGDALGGMDFSSLMGGAGAGAGLDGLDGGLDPDTGLGDDSDDEEIPDLETVQTSTSVSEPQTNEAQINEAPQVTEELKDEEGGKAKE